MIVTNYSKSSLSCLGFSWEVSGREPSGVRTLISLFKKLSSCWKRILSCNDSKERSGGQNRRISKNEKIFFWMKQIYLKYGIYAYII